MPAPNKTLHTEQDTTHFLFFDGDTIQDISNFHHELQAHASQDSSTGIPETKKAHKKDSTTRRGRSNMLDWTQYILVTGANQPLQNRMTGRQLRQGGSSWMTGPAAAVPAQRIGTQSGTPQFRSLLVQPFSRIPYKSFLKS